ncbi:carotenoid oxygenase [Macroventuria anomochaeta]|uniref:Carotenoid oxygenase n=1 Tax=Macroventuria anomochaeta TaxID=301207 RepID=A0ACB6RVK8_9PLEO|nr:carotenoid oxygenase [Macroventuria anomochaeta]KAF2625921.1 carotenoid oxygenase [Macroventuria anomochaeta]
MSYNGRSKTQAKKHPYLTGNFAPVTQTWTPTPVTWTGTLPKELNGGMYVRNGGNPMANADLGREAHWFDGDGMLSGVWFSRSPNNANELDVQFVNQFVLTDVLLSQVESSTLRTPILPSIATLTNPASSLFWIIWRIMRTVFIVLLSHLPGSGFAVKRISVANTSVLYHDGRALATCESGPPMRLTLPGLETVGWFDGNTVEGEPESEDKKEEPTLGGTGPLSWMREWSTGHPKVDNATGELVLFHCSFAPPYVQYSLIPPTGSNIEDHHSSDDASRIINAAVPGCTGGKLMHDFGVSKHNTVILDLPLSLSPLNLAKNSPVVAYEPWKPSRYGVFPRQHPEAVRWFETDGCCIFHTANTWDEYDADGNVAAVSLLACRLTSASVVFSAGNITPPPHPNHKDVIREKPMSFFAKYDDEVDRQDPEKMDETSPLISYKDAVPNSLGASSGLPISDDDEEQCRLYYYRFSLESATENVITHQFALAAIPVEFPTVSPLTAMDSARYIYACSTSNESFGAALGKASKIDILVRFDVKALLVRAQVEPPDAVTGCVDNRTLSQIMASSDPNDPIKVFRFPPKHYGQEATFIPRSRRGSAINKNTAFDEDDGYLVFYVFDEHQLNEDGECKEDAKSELWVLDAQTMARVECKIQLPTRIPYGLHGNWFTEEQIARQKGVEMVRALPAAATDTRWSRIKRSIHGRLG